MLTLQTMQDNIKELSDSEDSKFSKNEWIGKGHQIIWEHSQKQKEGLTSTEGLQTKVAADADDK